jgi:hypothetical protein
MRPGQSAWREENSQETDDFEDFHRGESN